MKLPFFLRFRSAYFGIELWLGMFLLIIILFGGIIWASFASLSGAVISIGTVILESNVQQVQHPDGGIVAEVLVKDGMVVKKDQPLIRLDDTITRTNYEILRKDKDKSEAQLSRLIAEKDKLKHINFPVSLFNRRAIKDIDDALNGEVELFKNRASALHHKKNQFRERIKQFLDEMDAYNALMIARKNEYDLLHREVEGTKQLVKKDFAPLVKLLSQQRELSALLGQHNQLKAQIAQTKGKILEVEVQISLSDEEFNNDVLKDLRITESRLSELQEKIIAAEDKLARSIIKAPANGIVHELQTNTIGGIIRGGETIVSIVPHLDRILIEAKVLPQDIDQVELNQKTYIRFVNFNRRTTPELIGSVKFIGVDLTQDALRKNSLQTPTRQEVYYPVKIEVEDKELYKLGGLKLLKGMTAETYIQTSERTVLSYLIKPLSDQFMKAFREK